MRVKKAAPKNTRIEPFERQSTRNVPKTWRPKDPHEPEFDRTKLDPRLTAALDAFAAATRDEGIRPFIDIEKGRFKANFDPKRSEAALKTFENALDDVCKLIAELAAKKAKPPEHSEATATEWQLDWTTIKAALALQAATFGLGKTLVFLFSLVATLTGRPDIACYAALLNMCVVPLTQVYGGEPWFSGIRATGASVAPADAQAAQDYASALCHWLYAYLVGDVETQNKQNKKMATIVDGLIEREQATYSKGPRAGSLKIPETTRWLGMDIRTNSGCKPPRRDPTTHLPLPGQHNPAFQVMWCCRNRVALIEEANVHTFTGLGAASRGSAEFWPKLMSPWAAKVTELLMHIGVFQSTAYITMIDLQTSMRMSIGGMPVKNRATANAKKLNKDEAKAELERLKNLRGATAKIRNDLNKLHVKLTEWLRLIGAGDKDILQMIKEDPGLLEELAKVRKFRKDIPLDLFRAASGDAKLEKRAQSALKIHKTNLVDELRKVRTEIRTRHNDLNFQLRKLAVEQKKAQRRVRNFEHQAGRIAETTRRTWASYMGEKGKQAGTAPDGKHLQAFTVAKVLGYMTALAPGGIYTMANAFRYLEESSHVAVPLNTTAFNGTSYNATAFDGVLNTTDVNGTHVNGTGAHGAEWHYNYNHVLHDSAANAVIIAGWNGKGLYFTPMYQMMGYTLAAALVLGYRGAKAMLQACCCWHRLGPNDPPPDVDEDAAEEIIDMATKKSEDGSDISEDDMDVDGADETESHPVNSPDKGRNTGVNKAVTSKLIHDTSSENDPDEDDNDNDNKQKPPIKGATTSTATTTTTATATTVTTSTTTTPTEVAKKGNIIDEDEDDKEYSDASDKFEGEPSADVEKEEENDDGKYADASGDMDDLNPNFQTVSPSIVDKSEDTDE